MRAGLSFCLSLPLDYPGGRALAPHRYPRILKPTERRGQPYFNYSFRIAIATAVLALIYLASLKDNGVELPGAARIGGAFELTSHEGRPFNSAMLKGRPYALFFGSTHCPDVCPTTLLEISNHLQALGSKADRLNVVFVTVDPERDSPEHLKANLAAFDRRIIGLTGDPAEIASVAHSFRAFYEKIPTSSGYTLSHTTTLYLIDPKGALAGTLHYQEPEGVQREKLRRLLDRK